jgi:heat shock protein HslJ
MKNIIPLFSLSFLLFLGFIACKPPQQNTSGRNPKMENKIWVLKELNGKSVNIPAEGKEINIKFESGNNTYEGDGGCNKINGLFTVQDDMIKIQSIASTKMACEQLATESEYFQMLDKANRYELKKKKISGIEKESLLLYNDKMLLATFEAK